MQCHYVSTQSLVKRIRAYGLSQKELGKLIGSTQASVSIWETRNVEAQVPTYFKLVALEEQLRRKSETAA